MIVKIEIVQISLVLNAKTWNVWMSLFWKILAYHWNFIRYWEKFHLTLTLKNRRCWWQLSADGTHYAIGWSDQKNLSHRNNWLRVVFVWVLALKNKTRALSSPYELLQLAFVSENVAMTHQSRLLQKNFVSDALHANVTYILTILVNSMDDWYGEEKIDKKNGSAILNMAPICRICIPRIYWNYRRI